MLACSSPPSWRRRAPHLPSPGGCPSRRRATLLAAKAALLALILASLYFPCVAQAQSNTDATLSNLTVTEGTLRPAFASDTTQYRVAVPNSARMVTVAATATEDRAKVEYRAVQGGLLRDADGGAAGFQVILRPGETIFRAKVTAEDMTATQAYTVIIERDIGATFGWQPTEDIALDADNGDPRGIWGNSTTIWVADGADTKLYAYALSDGTRQASQDIDLHTDNGAPWGIWSNGTTIWVTDSEDTNLYAYALSDGMRQTSQEFNLHTDNANPKGIWSDDTTIWVADGDDRNLYAYALSGGVRDMTKEFISPELNFPSTYANGGVWSDGDTIRVVGTSPSGTSPLLVRFTAFTLSGGARDQDNEFDAYQRWDGSYNRDGGGQYTNMKPTGIWSNGSLMWAADSEDGKLYAYAMPLSAADHATLSNLTVADGTLRPAFDSAVTSYRVAVPSSPQRVTFTHEKTEADSTVAYFVESRELEDADAHTDGFQVDVRPGRTWVSLQVTGNDGRAFFYNVGVERDSDDFWGWTPTRDIHGLAGTNQLGVWGDRASDTIWVTDSGDETLYAYKLSDGSRDTDKDISLDQENGDGNGVWGDSETIWVLDAGDEHVYAYKRSDGSRDAGKDVAVGDVEGVESGIWSDGTTMWVLGAVAPPSLSKLYAYTLSTGARDVGKDIELDATNTSPVGVWSNGETVWVIEPFKGLFAYKLINGSRDAEKDGDLGRTGLDWQGMWSDGETLFVLFRAEASVEDEAGLHSANTPPLSGDSAALESLEVEVMEADGTEKIVLQPPFAPDVSSYQAVVDEGVTQVMLSAMPVATGSVVDYLYEDGSTASSTVDLDKTGRTVVKARVTPAGGIGARTYTLEISQDSTAEWGHRGSQDFNTLASSSHRGLWAGKDTLYAAASGNTIYAFDRETKERDENKDITLDAANRHTRGIWSNGTTIWAADNADDILYAYTLSTGARDPDKDICLLGRAEDDNCKEGRGGQIGVATVR